MSAMIFTLLFLAPGQVPTTTTATAGLNRVPYLAPGERRAPPPTPVRRAPPPPPPPRTAPAATIPEYRAPTRFGERRTLSFDTQFGLSLAHNFKTDYREGTTSVELSPSLGYFIADDFGLLARFRIDYEELEDEVRTSLVLEVGLGRNFMVGSLVSIFPHATGGLIVLHQGSSTRDQNFAGVVFELAVPILFHPAPHFFLGCGPRFVTAYFPESEAAVSFGTSNLGFFVNIGGWL